MMIRTKRFEMRLSPEDREKLEYLYKRYNDKSAADFLIKFIRNEYEFCMQEDKNKETLEKIENRIAEGLPF